MALADDLFQAGEVPTSRALFHLVAACACNGRIAEARGLIDRLCDADDGAAAEVSTYNMLMHACLMSPNAAERAGARDVYSQMRRSGLGLCSRSGPNLLAHALEVQEIDLMHAAIFDLIQLGKVKQVLRPLEARNVKKGMGELRDKVTDAAYNVAKHFAATERWREIVDLVEALETAGLQQRGLLHAKLNAHEKLGQVDSALDAFDKMEEKNMTPSTAQFGAMITACARNHRVDDALTFFDQVREKNIIIYTSTIQACANTGEWKKAVELFFELEEKARRKRRLQPKAITFNAILDAVAPMLSNELLGVRGRSLPSGEEAEQRWTIAKLIWSRALECGIYKGIHKGNAFILDLHTMSLGAGEMAVRSWIDEVATPVSEMQGRGEKLPRLMIVTGRGKTRPGHQVHDLRAFIEELLLHMGVPTILPMRDDQAGLFGGAIFVDPEYLALLAKHGRRDWAST